MFPDEEDTRSDQQGAGAGLYSGKGEYSPLIRDTSGLKPPPDRRYGVFFIFGFLGLASLLPWNFFITAKQYFDYKLRNTSLPSNVSYTDKAHTTDIQVKFESYLSIVAMGFNLMFMIFAMLLVRSISVKMRIIVSTLLIILLFIVTTTLVAVDTDQWQQTFFIVTLITVALMNGGQSILTGSVLGLSAVFPPLYSQSAMIGQAAGGTFSSVVSILTQVTGDGAISSAVIYFLIATLVMVIALVLYILLYFMKYSRFFMANQLTPDNRINDEIPSYHGIVGRKEYFFSIWRKTWLHCLSLCMVFLVTLAVFPSVCAIIKSSSSNTDWSKNYFTPVVCFLFFNVGDFLGRMGTFVCKFPGPHRPRLMLFLCILCVAFIPLLMFCNARPRHHLPVVFEDDAYPVVFILLMGLTNGYLGTLCMSFGPMDVIDEQAEGAGMMLALSMTIGLAAGSGFSYLVLSLI